MWLNSKRKIKWLIALWFVLSVSIHFLLLRSQLKQQFVGEEQLHISKRNIYPLRIIHDNACSHGLLLWKSPQGLMNIWSPSLRQASNSSFERSSEFHCSCPRGYDQDGCTKSNQELNIPSFELVRCSFGWGKLEYSQLVRFDEKSQKSNHLNKMETLFSRYLHNRYHGGVLVPLIDNQTIIHTSQEDEFTPENPVDQFFLNLALNNTGWDDYDSLMINLLLTYNQKLFYAADSLLTGETSKSDWFNGKSIVLGKILYTFMFSKCAALSVIEYMLNVMYTTDHYYVLFLSENMNKCRSQVEDVVEKLRLSNSEATNIRIVPQDLSFKSFRAHITLVYMNIVPVIYSLLNGMTDWSHEVNLSESHFPLTSSDQFSQYLRNQTLHQTFVRTNHPEPYARYKYISHSCVTIDVLSETFGAQDIIPVGGSQWKIWSNIQWRSTLSSVTALNTLFKFKYSTIPDELFFSSMTNTFSILHTGDSSIPVLMVDGTRIIFPGLVNEPDNLTYLKWVHGVGSPMPITDQYLAEVIEYAKSGKLFFARKMMDVQIAKNITQTLGFSLDERTEQVPR